MYEPAAMPAIKDHQKTASVEPGFLGPILLRLVKRGKKMRLKLTSLRAVALSPLYIPMMPFSSTNFLTMETVEILGELAMPAA